MWINIITAILKLLGFVNAAEKLLAVKAAKKQAQEVADAPQTIKEEQDYFN